MRPDQSGNQCICNRCFPQLSVAVVKWLKTTDRGREASKRAQAFADSKRGMYERGSMGTGKTPSLWWVWMEPVGGGDGWVTVTSPHAAPDDALDADVVDDTTGSTTSDTTGELAEEDAGEPDEAAGPDAGGADAGADAADASAAPHVPPWRRPWQPPKKPPGPSLPDDI